MKSILFGAPAALVLSLSLALFALPSIVASADDADLKMEQIVVTATRTATTILDSPDNVTVITAEELSAAGVATAAEALEAVAGVEIADSGTAGSVKSVRIRGSASAQVLVLVDGVRMNDSRQGATDLSLLPVEMIERIEVVRGGTSALYGADALGGVVNIITKNRADRTLTLSVTNGIATSPTRPWRCRKGRRETPVGRGLARPGGHPTHRAAGVGKAGPGGSARHRLLHAGRERVRVERRRSTSTPGAGRSTRTSLEGSAFVSATTRADAATLGFKGQFDYSSTLVPGTMIPLPLSSQRTRHSSAPTCRDSSSTPIRL